MKLSVVIVNYNVEFFLEQCLNSVFSALKGMEGEVFVVDNNSVDGSIEMVRRKFPQAILIANDFNAGFSKANNQAMRKAKGEYILLLNPDTVVEEDTFRKTVQFMDEHPEAGGLGVKMIDGKGNFLPESKRGLPTPAVAFYKIFGLSRIFPNSKRFGQYHLGFLDKNKTHQVDILSGAFMLMRKEALDKIGLLDEDFFMYGEDIDLSWRIVKGGYKNYYFPETRIIHYKGESTKKSSVNYVFVFYNAMVIFARKHFSEKNARYFSFLIQIAIWFRASIAVVNRLIKSIMVPLTDLSFLVAGLALLAHFYQEWRQVDFPDQLIRWALPSYSLVWVITVWLSGGYDKPIRIVRIIRGILAGSAILLMVYGLLPKEMQFSRLFLLLGSIWAILGYLLSRSLLSWSGLKGYHLGSPSNKRFVIIGEHEECDRVSEILKQTNNQADLVLYAHPEKNNKEGVFIGSASQLNEITEVFKVDEVIFCAKDIPAHRIIDLMSQADNRKVDFKIAQPESLYLIGSNSIDTKGDLYVLEINSIRKPGNVRNKRLLDLSLSLILILMFPFFFWNRGYRKIFQKLPAVFFGKYTLVGYTNRGKKDFHLPGIRTGILTTLSGFSGVQSPEELGKKVDIIYAKDYTIWKDLRVLWNYLF